MKEILLFMSKYSTAVNKRIQNTLAVLPPEAFTKQHDTRFGTIYGVLNHIIFTDLLLFRVLRSIDPALIQIPTSNYDHLRAGYNHIMIDTIPEMKMLTENIESSIYQIVENLTEEQLRIYIPNLELSLYEIMTHVFVHRAHHRGELKSIFDSLGVQDDFAGTLNSLHTVK